MATKLTNLFGGAICCYIPPMSCDISNIRDIPDNQEVFAHQRCDQSIIIDLLEYVNECESEKAIEFHFRELTDKDSKIIQIEKLDLNLPNCESVYYLEGQHYVSKYKEDAKNLVNFKLALFRYKQYTTDILITFNDPVSISAESSSYALGTGDETKWNIDDFKKLIQTFKVVDFNLFAN